MTLRGTAEKLGAGVAMVEGEVVLLGVRTRRRATKIDPFIF